MKDDNTAARVAATNLAFKMSRDQYQMFMRGVLADEDTRLGNPGAARFLLAPDLTATGEAIQCRAVKFVQVFANSPVGPILAVWKGPDGGSAEITVLMRRPIGVLSNQLTSDDVLKFVESGEDDLGREVLK